MISDDCDDYSFYNLHFCPSSGCRTQYWCCHSSAAGCQARYGAVTAVAVKHAMVLSQQRLSSTLWCCHSGGYHAAIGAVTVVGVKHAMSLSQGRLQGHGAVSAAAVMQIMVLSQQWLSGRRWCCHSSGCEARYGAVTAVTVKVEAVRQATIGAVTAVVSGTLWCCHSSSCH